ncbi:MAG: response regulator [Ferruginibacter sp.]
MEKILVVNNDFDTMSLLKNLLEKRAYKVKYTSKGDEVIAMAQNFEPDLVLIDVLQKKFIADLKTHPATSYIPVIMMTGYTWNYDKLKDVEADDVIEKPFLLDQLQKKIQWTLKKTNR